MDFLFTNMKSNAKLSSRVKKQENMNLNIFCDTLMVIQNLIDYVTQFMPMGSLKTVSLAK